MRSTPTYYQGINDEANEFDTKIIMIWSQIIDDAWND